MEIGLGFTQGSDLIGHHLTHLVASHRHFSVREFVLELLLLGFLLSYGLFKLNLLSLRLVLPVSAHSPKQEPSPDLLEQL